MRRYVLRRVAAFVATLFFVSLLVFVVVRVLPGDPALIIMGTEGSPEATARLREAMGLNRPIAVQYADRAVQPHRSEEHTSELQSRLHLVCRLLLEKKKKNNNKTIRE